ncbi:hypothetical protein Bca101_020078 [Brassica carinata]
MKEKSGAPTVRLSKRQKGEDASVESLKTQRRPRKLTGQTAEETSTDMQIGTHESALEEHPPEEVVSPEKDIETRIQKIKEVFLKLEGAKEAGTPKEMQARKEIPRQEACDVPPRHQQPRQEASHVPPRHQQPRQEADDDVVELTRRQYQRARQEADDDVVELTEGQYRRALGYLIRIEEDEEVIDPMYRRVMTRQTYKAATSSQWRRPKQEKGESSRGKGRQT